jgi:hypothetical protein
MTHNRMEAKPIAGEHCRFCGDAKAPLVKTPCCQQWICCDTAFMSFRGGGRCQVEHERFSLCYSHYQDQHGGLGKVVSNAAISGRHEITKSMRKTPSIGQDIEAWERDQ